jgi:hypothetical protein
LALVAGKELWIASAALNGKGDVVSLSIERVDLRLERVRASFSESYSPDSATPIGVALRARGWHGTHLPRVEL